MTAKNKKSYICVIGAAIAFGTMEIALKVGGASFPALQMTFLRFLIGGLVLLPFALVDLKKRGCRLNRADLGYLFLLGIINTGFSMTLFQMGVMMTNAGLAAIIISTNPVFTMIFAHFLVNDRFTRKKAVVLILSVTGLFAVANPDSFDSGSSLKGILIVIVAAAGFGLYTALGKRRIDKIGGLAQNSFSFLLGSVAELIVLLATGQPVFSGISADNIGVLLYVGVIVTGFGYVCYMKAIELAGPSTASVSFFIKPVIAVILAALILDEKITWNMVVGMILISAGFLYNLKGKAPAASEKEN